MTNIDLNIFNDHWAHDFSYNFEKERGLYKKIEGHLYKKYILSIIGLRRTGKTTLMKQLIDKLIANGTPRQNILLYSFDVPAELGEVIDIYVGLSGKDLKKDKVFLFLDEVQKLDNWQDKVKVYYDNHPNLKIIVSGSSSVFIRKRSESLAGRILEFELEPLSFREYLLFKGKADLLENPRLFAKELEKQFESYLLRQFIEIIDEDQETSSQYTDTLVRKIIFEDIPSVYPVEQPQAMLRILQILANNPGMLIDYKSLSIDLGLNEKTLANYFEFMERAYLLHKCYNFSKNLLTSEKRLKKAYLKTSSFCSHPTADITKIVENCVVTQLKSRFFWRKTHEVDCVLNDGKLPVEIKYSGNIKPKDLNGLKKFMEEFKTREGVVLTKNIEKKQGNISFVPVWKFLLEHT